MPTIKTAISLQKALFEQLEVLARKLKVSRSRLFSLALESFVRQHRNLDLLQQINAAYSEPPGQDELKLRGKLRKHHRRIVESEW